MLCIEFTKNPEFWSRWNPAKYHRNQRRGLEDYGSSKNWWTGHCSGNLSQLAAQAFACKSIHLQRTQLAEFFALLQGLCVVSIALQAVDCAMLRRSEVERGWSGGRGFFVGLWILRFRLRLRAEWQGGGRYWESESFYLMLWVLALDWFICWALNKSGSSCIVRRGILQWTGFFFYSHVTPHVILHGGLARSCRIYFIHKRRKTFFLGRKCPSGRMRSGEKGLFPGPHPPSATVPPLPEGESSLVEYGFCDFVFGSPQNDRVGGGSAKSESFHFRVTNHNGVWCFVYWSLKLIFNILCRFFN